MKRQLKIHSSLALIVLLVVAFQNCSDQVAFSVPIKKLADMYWTAVSGQKVATTSDIKKMDWNKDGVEDVVFSYSGGADKITEICMSVKTSQMQKNCYSLGQDNLPIPEGGSQQELRHNIATVCSHYVCKITSVNKSKTNFLS